MNNEIRQSLKALKARGVKRIAYFHCDHFEPWRTGAKQVHADELSQFQEQSALHWFSKKMTLFYKPHVPYSVAPEGSPPLGVHVDGEPIYFPELLASENEITRNAMRPLREMGHEIQVHIHHEGFTLSDVNHHPALNEWLEEHGTEDADAARLRIAIQRHLDQSRHDTGATLDKWLFVHGNWALNASDHSICRIRNEIQILQSMGCVGDFTFPAGRRQVDPDVLMEPYTCKAGVGDKIYDTPAADPRGVSDPQSKGEGRFFIWNSAQKHPQMSLDLYNPKIYDQFLNVEDVLTNWLCNAPVYGDTLYIKTYAHSINGRYFNGETPFVIPHNDPRVVNLFNKLEATAEKAGMDLEVTTAFDVYERLQQSVSPVKQQTTAPKPKTSERTSMFGSLFKKKQVDDIAPIADPVAVENVAVRTLRKRIEAMGEKESGAYAFYKVRVERDELATRFEREMALKVLERDPSVAEIVDIGAGLGSLALCFAIRGRKAVALEYDRRRVAAAEAIRSRIGDYYPKVCKNFSILQGAFPETSPKRSSSKGLFAAVTTNVMGTLAAEVEDQIIGGLAQFDVAYIDLQRLGVSRKGEEQYNELLAKLAKVGMTRQELLVDQGDAGYYYRVSKGA